MREIKFRAWDKKIKEFHYFLTARCNDVFWYMVKLEKMPLMQYTGLKDKNGKDIYEGDITQVFDNRHVVKYGIARRDMASGWAVDIPCFYFDLISHEFKAFPIVKNIKGRHDLEDMEIIGNIYENPELVKQ